MLKRDGICVNRAVRVSAAWPIESFQKDGFGNLPIIDADGNIVGLA